MVSDLHEMLYEKKLTSMLLYNTGSWSAGDGLLNRYHAINHPDQQETLYQKNESAGSYITLDPDQQVLYWKYRLSIKAYDTIPDEQVIFYK